MASIPHDDILQLVERAADRRRRTVLLELRRGIDSLATIVVIAPWLGILATPFSILDGFKGCCGDQLSHIAAVMSVLGRALLPTALGLAVAVPTNWLYRHLQNRLESLDHELRLGISELIQQLRPIQPSET